MQLLIYEKKWLILRMLTIFPFKIVGNLKELTKQINTHHQKVPNPTL